MSRKYFQAGTPATLPVPAAQVGMFTAPPFPLISWRSPGGEARPTEVALTCSQAANTPITVQDVGLFAGPLNDANNAWQCGYFLITYGQGAVVRRRIVDLVSATLYLGICDQVSVTAFRWRGQTWPDYTTGFAEVLCGASLGPAEGGEYDELTHTVQYFLAAASAAEQTFVVPPGAYDAAITCGHYDPTVDYWGSTEPDMLLNGFNPTVIRPSQYTVVPPFRRVGVAQPYRVITRSNVVANTVLTVQWYLNV